METLSLDEHPALLRDADASLERRLLAALSGLHFPAFRFLSIDVHDGVAILQGRVGSFYQRQLATKACRRLLGEHPLVDSLTVDRQIPAWSTSETRRGARS